MKKDPALPNSTIKIYNGYGHTNNLVVYGHVLAGKSPVWKSYRNNAFSNFVHLIKLFFVKPIPHVKVQLLWGNQEFYSTTEPDGFFKFEWQSNTEITAGWHPVKVNLLNTLEQVVSSGEGKIFIPHSTQYAFISDIDDTVLISHSSTTGRKLRVLFTKNPRSRKTFADVVKFYKLLSLSHTEPSILNPFFYVSSSEWNLYDYLTEFFQYNTLPEGIFLLNQIKRWYQIFKTGKTKHQGKLMRVARIMDAFPKQLFVLLGDNSQSDPEIYATIANKYPERIIAIYIRNIYSKKESLTKELMTSLQNKGVHTCLFKHTDEAILHAQSIGLIT